MGKPTGFMDYKRQELALRPPQAVSYTHLTLPTILLV